MLERDYLTRESYYEREYREGIEEGKVTGIIMAYIIFIIEHGEEDYVQVILQKEKYLDLLHFKEKYPLLNYRRLARRVIAESEYWYL
ncbi:MAG: hypothetical protein PHX08_14985 [Lachnospiraceae bacterium]|nr:hypothetical protein [Lachnospiraceae bacterium]